MRLGDDATIDTLEYGEQLTVGDAHVSLHPAGHVLGSAQVRIESGGKVVVHEQVEAGLDSFPAALEKMFSGGHCGKMLVDLSAK